MEQEDQISVIVPVYNVERYLPRCVDSILGQTYENLKVILVDDGATDGSGAVCDEYAARDSRVRVIHKENGGLSSARNAGLEVATGAYIAFVDSDDWIEPEMYGYMLSLAKKYGVKLVCAGRYDEDEATGVQTKGLCPAAEEKISTETLVGRIFLWEQVDSAAWDKLYHRSLLEGIRYPEGRVCEDVPVTYRVALRTDYAAMGDRPMYHYLHRPGSITKSAVSEKTFHFSQHAEQVYRDVQAHYPALEPQARYLWVRSLQHLLLVMETKGEKTWEVYPAQYRAARGALRENLGFLRTAPYFSRQEKLTGLLLVWELYRPLRALYHRESKT